MLFSIQRPADLNTVFLEEKLRLKLKTSFALSDGLSFLAGRGLAIANVVVFQSTLSDPIILLISYLRRESH
ncbi:hypothetical protein Y696_11175 [Mesotoga sp. H07pep.5.4]|nr:hypothetical protein Y696_11175 [Mesotoga sp. H07pep.5.4]